MRPVRARSSSQPKTLADQPVELVRSGPAEFAYYTTTAGERITAACVRCEERWCARFPEFPVGRLSHATGACPVNAVGFTEAGEAEISDNCIGCGICALRCPYGGIALADGRAIAQTPSAEYVDTDANSVRELIRSISIRWDWPEKAREEFVARMVDGLAAETKSSYYELVGRLLSAAGVPTDVPPGGVNPNRFDAVVVDDEQSLPAEIKSPREEPFAGIKAVEQALENKVILDARFAGTYPSRPDAATLAIGHELPPERSDVAELINDIDQSFDIHVAVLSLSQIYAWVLSRVVDGEQLLAADLADRRGY